jgi:hypothetical protein
VAKAEKSTKVVDDAARDDRVPDVSYDVVSYGSDLDVEGLIARLMRGDIKIPEFQDDAATKLIWLALRNITATWARAAPTWKTAMNQFAILYGDRFTTPNA